MNQAVRIKRAVEKARKEFLANTDKHIRTVLYNYETALNDITTQLASMDKSIDSFSTQRLMELQNSIAQRIEQIKNVRYGQVVDALNDAGKSGFDTQMIQREIMGRPLLGVSWDFFVPRGVEYYQSFALQLCDQYDQELVNAIQYQLRMGFIERKSWSDIITDIRQNAFGFKKYQRVDRKDKGATWKIKRMVRTEMQRMRTMAEEEVVRQDPDIIGVAFYFGGGPCDGSCVKLVGEYYKDGSGKGWPPPSIPIHPNCYSKDTEVYTDKGWLLFSELSGEEKIFSLNPETLEADFLPYVNYIKYRYQGEMHRFYNRNFDLMVTPDHNHFIQTKKEKQWKIVSGKDLPLTKYGDVRFYRGLNWKGQNLDFVKIGDINLPVDVYCAFMGYYLSEGSVTRLRDGAGGYRNKWQVTISQSKEANEEKYNTIRELLEKMPIEWWTTKNGFLTTNDDLCNYVLKFGKCSEKYVPETIKQLSPEKIKIFLDAYMLGDGSDRKGKNFKNYSFDNEVTYFTCSKQLADDLGELILKAGYRPSYYLRKNKGKITEFKNGDYEIKQNVWVIRRCNSLTASVIKKESVQYDDYVYDVELPKWHVLLVRRNGKIVWSGNCTCYTTNIYPEIKHYIRSLAKQETEKEVPAYIREVNDLITKGINTPDDAIRLGGVLRKEVNSRLDNKLIKEVDDLIQKEKIIDEFHKKVLSDYLKAYEKYYETFGAKEEEILNLLAKKEAESIAELKAIRLKIIEKQGELQAQRSSIIKEVIKEIRDTGEGVLFKFAEGSNFKAEKVIHEVFDFLPKEWAEESAKTPLQVLIQDGRAFYRRGYGGTPAKIVFTRGEEMDAAIHEVGHRVSNTHPMVGKLEKAFYEERTKGHSPVRIPGYPENEQYIPDDWSDPYVGKYYPHGAYEILSTGLEGLFASRPTIDIWKDLKHVDFILGLLGGV